MVVFDQTDFRFGLFRAYLSYAVLQLSCFLFLSSGVWGYKFCKEWVVEREETAVPSG